VADPHHLPRWWPLVSRVEDVHEADDGGPARWTVVLKTQRGSGVRADFSRTVWEPQARLGWAQQVTGTPFERILKAASVAIAIRPEDDRAVVTLTSDETLRGLSRLGAPMMRRAAARRLTEALRNLDRALTGHEDHEG
jgi:uncharacterized protein YndB with AHSA1/START domain